MFKYYHFWDSCIIDSVSGAESLEKPVTLSICEQLTHLLGRKETTEDEMVGWHHRLDGREFE